MDICHTQHVVRVSNWERSNKFYTRVLGAELIVGETYWAYRFGKQQVNCTQVESATASRQIELCFVWPTTIENAVAHLERNGVRVERGPRLRFGAQGIGRSICFRDPDGALLELISYETRGAPSLPPNMRMAFG